MRGTVRKRGNRWYYTLDLPKINGKRRQIERVGGDTKEEAENALLDALNEIRNTGRFRDASNISASDYFEYWYENYVMTNLKYNTQQNYRGMIDNHILPYLNKYYLKEIDPYILQNMMNAEYKKGFAKKTLSILKTVLHGALKKAVYPYQFIKENPMQYVEMPKYNERMKPTKEDLKIISSDDWEKLRAAVTEDNPLYVPMMIAYYTGMRRGEVCGLEWDKVSLDEQTIEVVQIMLHENGQPTIGTPKTQASYRIIDIGETLTNLLKIHKKKQLENRLRYGQYYQQNNFVCTKENGSPVTPNSIKRLVSQARERTGVAVNFHAFRHTHATVLLEAGASVKEVQDRLGHSKAATTTDTYVHLTRKKKKSTAALFDRVTDGN